MITMAPASPTADLRDRLAIPGSRLDDLNAFLLDPDARIVNDLLAVVARYGTPDEINRKAREAGALPAAAGPRPGDPARLPAAISSGSRSSASAASS